MPLRVSSPVLLELSGREIGRTGGATLVLNEVPEGQSVEVENVRFKKYQSLAYHHLSICGPLPNS